jgi:hypothetical protein
VASTIVTAGALSLQQNPVNPVVLPPQFSLRFPPRIGAPLIADPYAGTLTHAFLTTGMPITGNCTPATNQTSTTYLVGNCVVPSPGLIVKPAEIVDLVPGTYWINGDLTVAPPECFIVPLATTSQGAVLRLFLQPPPQLPADPLVLMHLVQDDLRAFFCCRTPAIRPRIITA